jgi:hypothetical protein
MTGMEQIVEITSSAKFLTAQAGRSLLRDVVTEDFARWHTCSVNDAAHGFGSKRGDVTVFYGCALGF